MRILFRWSVFLLSILFLSFFQIHNTGFAQSKDSATQTVIMQVAEFSVLDITGSPSKLTVYHPGMGGLDPLSGSDDSTFARYTVIAQESRTRSISVNWGLSDSAPPGCSLWLEAFPSGRTNEGQGRSLKLSSFPQTLIENIGSCATGIAASSGARLKYSLRVDDVTRLSSGSTSSAVIVLTISDES